MPKAGFKSLTIREGIYDSFEGVYNKNKESLQMFGINSFTGFLTYILNDVFTDDPMWNLIMSHIARNQTHALKGLIREK